MLKYYNEVYDNISPFYYYSKDNTITNIDNPEPYLIISYRNQNGLEDYMSYQTIDVGLGTSYINNLTGNITNVLEVNKTIGGKHPIALDLIYNTNDIVLNNVYNLNLGYKWNYYQTLKETTIDSKEYLEYLDTDGTIHYLPKEEEKYIDEDGLNLTVTKENNQYIMKDKIGNQMKFILNGSIYYLKEIIDIDGNHTLIEYTNDKITKITDANDEAIQISYAANQITCTSEYITSILHITNTQISSIENKFGITEFTYNNKKILTKVKNINGKSIQYVYYDNSPYRLQKVMELGINEEEGTSLEFIYSFLVTRVIDNKGRVNTYSFNEQGNTIGLTNLKEDNNFIDSYGIYKQYDNYNNASKNKLLLNTNATKYTNNLLLDSSFENGYSESLKSMTTTENARSGKCLKVSGIATIVFPQVKETGIYTFSGYFNHSCDMELTIRDENTLAIKTEYYKANQEYERYAITIELTANKAYVLNVEAINGVVYLDDMQLEKGDIANPRNVIENSDFSHDLTSWTNRATDINGNTVINNS